MKTCGIGNAPQFLASYARPGLSEINYIDTGKEYNIVDSKVYKMIT